MEPPGRPPRRRQRTGTARRPPRPGGEAGGGGRDGATGVNHLRQPPSDPLPSPPSYRKVNPSDSPIMILSVQSDAAPLIEVDDYADNILSQQLSQISGVSQIFIGGEQKRAVRVQVDPGRLAAMGLTLEDVR